MKSYCHGPENVSFPHDREQWARQTETRNLRWSVSFNWPLYPPSQSFMPHNTVLIKKLSQFVCLLKHNLCHCLFVRSSRAKHFDSVFNVQNRTRQYFCMNYHPGFRPKRTVGVIFETRNWVRVSLLQLSTYVVVRPFGYWPTAVNWLGVDGSYHLAMTMKHKDTDQEFKHNIRSRHGHRHEHGPQSTGPLLGPTCQVHLVKFYTWFMWHDVV